jgi:hypothetical protein
MTDGVACKNYSGFASSSVFSGTGVPGVTSALTSPAIIFNGNMHYTVTPLSLFSMPGPMSICLNYKSTQIGGSNCICAASDGGGGTCFVLTGAYSAGKLNFWNDASGTVASSATNSNDGVWRHWTIVRTGSSGAWTISFYVNGLLDAAPALITNPAAVAVGAFCINQFGSFAGYNFAWSGSDLRIYNRALSAAEAFIVANEAYQHVPDIETLALMSAQTAPVVTAVMRKTLSPVGTRTGSRQAHGSM